LTLLLVYQIDHRAIDGKRLSRNKFSINLNC